MTEAPEPTRLPDLADVLRHAGAAPALGIGERCWSYSELGALVAARAQALHRLGVALGQVVLCPAEPGLDLFVMQFALVRLGAAMLPAPPHLSRQELASLIERTGAEWHWRPGTGDGSLQATGRGAPSPDAYAAPEPADPLAVLIQTSGSSGAPKVVMLSQRAVLASSTLINRRLGLGPDDEWLCCLPLHHVGGLAIGYRCALAGARVRLQTRLAEGFDAVALAADLAACPVTHLSLVPPMLARLLDAGVRPPPSLRVLLLGGQALHPALARRAASAGWPLHLTYGMSETFSQIATGQYAAAAAASGRVGPALPGIMLDCAGCGETPRPLRLRGPMLMAGYANPTRRPGDGLRDGWLETADLVCIDLDGALHVLGRADEMLVIGGVNVLPGEVEGRLADVPGVHAVGVVGVPHPVWGRTLAVCYTGSAARSAVEGWCRSHLSSAERPRIFVRCTQLPLLPSGKLDRAALRDLATAGIDGRRGDGRGHGQG